MVMPEASAATYARPKAAALAMLALGIVFRAELALSERLAMHGSPPMSWAADDTPKATPIAAGFAGALA